MSELENKDSAEETPQADVPEEQVSQPKMLKVHGKEFDISNEQGLIHAQAWAEAMSSLVGRQGQELGQLRKFAGDRQPTKDEQQLIQRAKQLESEGDTSSAIDLMFQYAKETEVEVKRQLQRERQNSETWDAYFESRPELLKMFNKQTIRKVSETSFDLPNEEDPFSKLDAFWMPKVAGQTTEKPRSQDKPPQTLSGGSTPKSAPRNPAKDTKTPSLDELLDARSDSKFRF